MRTPKVPASPPPNRVILATVSEETYLRLYSELNASRFDSDVAERAIAELGGPARVIRGLARMRRHRWQGARTDLLAALDSPPVAPLTQLVAGVGLWVARAHDQALTALARAAGYGKPGIAKQARIYAQQFARLLGWTEEARRFEHALGIPVPPPITLDSDPERAAAQAWAAMYEHGVAAIVAELEALNERHQGHPAVLAVRLRLDLVEDRLERALARLAGHRHADSPALALERATLALADGRPQQALDELQGTHEGARAQFLRGLARSRIGDHVGATALLQQARGAAPDSVVIALALALARYHVRPDSYDEDLDRRFETLANRAPGLLGDAADEAGIVLWVDDGLERDRERQVEILTVALAMSTADLDLEQLSYRRPTAPLRHVPATPLAGTLSSMHADDRARVDHIDRVFVRALGIKPPRPDDPGNLREPPAPEPPGRWSPQTLSPAEIEQFLTDGFIVIHRAFDPELARRWREDANRRIREEPHRWVRGYDPDDEARSLRHYSPEDPSTWTWGRIDLHGPETLAIDEFAPRAWGAICDLLGGPTRVETRSWTNYLIINLCDDTELDFDQPPPGWISWHIDDPGPAMRLDNVRNGLVGIALFDRLLPSSGNTWLVPDSIPRVARILAAHPEGVDFVADRGNRITAECERFHEVVGEAGDILLMHPFMMHSGSPNRSGRIRWMSNPMVYLNEPLDPFRPDPELSPVERAIQRALVE
jgi:hypothetical protein